jgi:hypothetical protein
MSTSTIQPPPHVHGLLPQGGERLVRRSSRSKAVRTVQKVLFVHGFQHHDDRPLEDLILESRDTDRTCLHARPFRYVHPPHRRCPVRAGLGSVQEIDQLGLQVVADVLLGSLSVHADRTVFARARERLMQPVHVDEVGQGSKCQLWGLLRPLCYPLS